MGWEWSFKRVCKEMNKEKPVFLDVVLWYVCFIYGFQGGGELS